MVEHFKIEKWFNELSEMEFKQKIAELVIKNLLRDFNDNETHSKAEKSSSEIKYFLGKAKS